MGGIIEVDADIQGACEAIMEYVHNLTDERRKEIQTIKESGVEIGYRRTAFATFMRREVFIKTLGYKINELSKPDIERIMAAVFNAFVIPGASMPEITQIAKDCMLLKQDYIPMIPVEKSPGLVSIAGGFNA